MKDDLTFENTIQCEIERFKKESKKHKRQYKIGKLLAILAVTLIPVITILNSTVSFPYSTQLFTVLNAILSATSITMTWLLDVNKSFELWKTETAVYHTLADIKRNIDFAKAIGTWDRKKQLDAINKIDIAIKASGKSWEKMLKASESKEG